MSPIGALLGKFFRSVDLFPNSKLLRYKGEGEYTTITGGIISSMVIIIFIILFASMGLKTLNRELITSSVSNQFQIQPSELSLIASPQAGFMFGVFVYGIDLNTPVYRLFDITLHQQFYSTGHVLINDTTVPLVQCTEEHFKFDDQLKEMYGKLKLNIGLCPPLGYEFKLRGKLTSDIFASLQVLVKRCNSTTDPTCAPDAYFSAVEATIGQFPLFPIFVNTQINPNNQQFKAFTLEDTNYLPFTSTMGISALGLIQQDLVQTDESILPFTQLDQQYISHIPSPFTTSYYLTGPDKYLAQINIQKSPTMSTYQRNFNKLDAYFSYVGGLVGTIIGLIFIMSFYTEKAYQVSLAKKIFLDQDNKQIQSRSFNIAYYCAVTIKPLLDFIKIRPNWPKTQKFIDSCEEVAMQIDIAYIVRRLMFFDAALSKLLQRHELQVLYMREKPSIDKVKDQRRLHSRPEILNQEIAEFNSGRPLENIKQMNDAVVFNQFYEYGQAKPEQYITDYSAEEFSRRGLQVGEIRAAMHKVLKEQREGKAISRKIMEQISPQMILKIGHFESQKSQEEQKKSRSDQKCRAICVQSIHSDQRSSMGQQVHTIQKTDYNVQASVKGRSK